jgi:hypothetical protein
MKLISGIVQGKVDRGKPLDTCLGLFNAWVNKIVKDRGLELPSTESECTEHKEKLLFSFVTWTGKKRSLMTMNTCLLI